MIDPDANFELNEDGDEIAQELAQLLMSTGALKFGKFPLRNGRASPYTLDLNSLCGGAHSWSLGRPYAKTIDHCFGPSATVFYATSQRALPLAVLAAWYYSTLCNPTVLWCCPTSGDRPANTPAPLMGALPTALDNVVIIDDIFTSGLAVREAISRLKIMGASIMGVCALVDRMEKSKHGRSMVAEIKHDTGVRIATCTGILNIIKHIPEAELSPERRATIVSYLTERHVTIEPGKPRGSTNPD